MSHPTLESYAWIPSLAVWTDLAPVKKRYPHNKECVCPGCGLDVVVWSYHFSEKFLNTVSTFTTVPAELDEVISDICVSSVALTLPRSSWWLMEPPRVRTTVFCFCSHGRERSDGVTEFYNKLWLEISPRPQPQRSTISGLSIPPALTLLWAARRKSHHMDSKQEAGMTSLWAP